MICNKCNHNLPDDSEFCQYCGTKVEKGFVISTEAFNEQLGNKVITQNAIKSQNAVQSSKTVKSLGKKQKSKLIFFSNISSVILSGISLATVIVAISALLFLEYTYDFVGEFFLELSCLFVFSAFFAFSIFSLIVGKYKLLAILSPILLIINIVFVAIEGVIYFSDFADAMCVVGTISSILILVFTLLPVFSNARQKAKIKKHSSVGYREKCYKKIAKVHEYLEKGIITKEEYEKMRQDILKDVID